jgi:hypothetical protein
VFIGGTSQEDAIELKSPLSFSIEDEVLIDDVYTYVQAMDDCQIHLNQTFDFVVNDNYTLYLNDEKINTMAYTNDDFINFGGENYSHGGNDSIYISKQGIISQ